MGGGGGEIAASRIVSCGGAAFAGYSSAFAVTTPCRNVPSSLPRAGIEMAPRRRGSVGALAVTQWR